MKTSKPQKAWVVQWSWIGEHDKPKQQACYFLSPRLTRDKVTTILEALYINSEFVYAQEKLEYIRYSNRRSIPCQFLGKRIYVGDGPCLMACKVDDLVIEWDSELGPKTARWTQPPTSRRNMDTLDLEQMGVPVRKSWVFPA